MKNLIKFILSIALMSVAIYFIHDYYSNMEENGIKTAPSIGNNTEFIASLKKENNNNEIVMYLEIPDVFGLPIAQTENNEYYYKHDIKKEENKNGAPFLDYRTKSLNDKKLIIYGHNKSYRSLVFNNILNYQKEDFFKKHPNIYIYTNDVKREYKIFSSFIETDEDDYLSLTNFNNIEFYEHLLKYKDKSLYDTKVVIDGESKVIVLTTNATTDYDDKEKHQVIFAIENKDYAK